MINRIHNIFMRKNQTEDRIKSKGKARLIAIKAMEAKETKDNTQKKYDEINEDIYSCFIFSKKGVCEKTGGTMETFQKLEKEISNICSSQKGKYFKSQAKSAKFAIIFSVKNRSLEEINSLREKGYKVTTLENALAYFKRTDLWNIDQLKKAEQDFLKSN